MIKEEPLHMQIADYLRLVIKKPHLWHTVEVSNQSSGRAAMMRQMKLTRKGVVTGWPDIEIFIHHGLGVVKLLFMEVKTKDGPLTVRQKLVHDMLRSCNHAVHVVRSIEDVQVTLKQHGVI